jgi:hypothetical protein
VPAPSPGNFVRGTALRRHPLDAIEERLNVRFPFLGIVIIVFGVRRRRAVLDWNRVRLARLLLSLLVLLQEAQLSRISDGIRERCWLGLPSEIEWTEVGCRR